MDPNWIAAFPLDHLPAGGARLYKEGAIAIAVFRLPEGLFAVDNRCPHEGYPLLQGATTGCVLTCKWHNYKFDLRDGRCVMGEEDVRVYPVRVVEGQVEIDLTPPASLLAGLWADLERALSRQEMGRAARDVVRLLDLGVSAERIATYGAEYDARRGEYGPSHALAVAEEVLTPTPGVDPVLPLVQALDMAARPNIRLSPRVPPEPIDPGPDPVAAGVRLRHLVETEDASAEALVRGAVARGWGRREIEPWLFRLCADHFLDFGHALIYTTKVFALVEAGGDGATLLGALTHGIVCGTREDTLPAWSGWRTRYAGIGPAGSTPLDRDALFELAAPEAFAAVASASDAIDALSLAAAERMLRFDRAIDADPTTAEGWLDVTHIQTFTHAVRLAGRRWSEPEGVRRLQLQAAQFVAMSRVLDGERPRWTPLPSTIDEIARAVAERRTEEALDRVAGSVPDLTAEALRPLASTLEAVVMRDHGTRAIVLTHLLKNLRAGVAETVATGDVRPLLAAVRFLASPVRERSIERTVGNAIALVRHGRPPRTLVG